MANEGLRQKIHASIPQSQRGALLIMLGAALWGLSFYAAMLGTSEPPLLLTFWVSLFAACYALLSPGSSWRDLTALLRKYPLDICGVAITGMLLGNLLLYLALARIDLALCSLLERVQPIAVVLLSYFFLGERLSFRAAVLCGLALLGASLLVIKDSNQISLLHLDPWGVAAILGAGISWAFSTIFGKRLVDRQLSARDLSALRFVLASALLLPLLPLLHTPAQLMPSGLLLGVAAVIAALGYGGFLLYYRGLPHVSANRSAFLELTQPLTGILIGLFALGEELSLLQWIGAPLLLGAIVLLAREK